MLVSNDILSTKIYDKRDNFNFEIFNFSFLDAMLLTLHPIEFHVVDFNTC